MEIKRNGSRPSGMGRPSTSPAPFASTRCSMRRNRRAASAASVTFRGRRPHRVAHASAWPDPDRHSRSRLGAALGRAQRRRSGQATLIWFPPGEKAFGTAPRRTTAMTHIAIVEELGGKSADWAGEVSEDQYGA